LQSIHVINMMTAVLVATLPAESFERQIESGAQGRSGMTKAMALRTETPER